MFIRKMQEQALFQAVEKVSNEQVASEVVYGKTQEAAGENDAQWVSSAMKRLESRFDNSLVKEIRMNCQCSYGMDEKLTLVQELMAASSSLEEFAGLEKATAAGLSLIDGQLHLQFPFCPCPMLADVDRLDTDTWCQCTTGYSKVLFEKAFGCTVDVILLESIKMGDDRCLMKIIPEGPIWK